MLLAPHDTVSRALIDSVCHLYDLSPTAFDQPNKGYRNRSFGFTADNRHYNLLLYKREANTVATIKAANRMGDTLAREGFPARQTVDGRILRVGDRYACLYWFVPGVTIPWEAYTRRHLFELGSTMARMHRALSKSDLALQPIEEVLEHQLAEMMSYFRVAGVRRALQAKLQLALVSDDLSRHKQVIADLRALPRRQPLHMDYVRGNVLFADSSNRPKITGVIDFEKAACGHPLIDVARTLAFLVVDCQYQTPARVQHHFLGRGYMNQVPDGANSMTTGLFSDVVNFFLIHDFYKFLLHNPYESLPNNLHFRRTAALLAHKKLLNVL